MPMAVLIVDFRKYLQLPLDTVVTECERNVESKNNPKCMALLKSQPSKSPFVIS